MGIKTKIFGNDDKSQSQSKTCSQINAFHFEF